ncbi:MAG: hypothetical protein Fur0034_01070 [Desulfuromonadia bacterium]
MAIVTPILLSGWGGLGWCFTPPMGDQWFVITRGGDRVGTLHIRLSPLPTGFLLTAEGGATMTIFGFRRDAVSRERYHLLPDLTIDSFEIRQRISGSPLDLSGSRTDGGYRVLITTSRGREERQLAIRPPLYPAPLLPLLPLLEEPIPKKMLMTILDPEEAKARKISITHIGREGSPPLHHFINDLYPVVDNHVWVDEKGRLVRESVRNGTIETRRSTPSEVREVANRLGHRLP